MVAIKRRGQTMPAVGAALADHVDNSARPVSELSLVTGGQHLEFKDCILVELGGRAAIHTVVVGHPVNQELSVVAPLPEDGNGAIRPLVILVIDGYARN